VQLQENNLEQKNRIAPLSSGRSFDESNDIVGDRVIPAMQFLLHPTPVPLSVHSASHDQYSGELSLSLGNQELTEIRLLRDTMLFPLAVLGDGARLLVQEGVLPDSMLANSHLAMAGGWE